MRNQRRAGNFGQCLETARLWFVEKIAAVQVEQVEPEWRHGQFAAHALDILFAPKSPHGYVKRLGPAVRQQAQHLAIQDQVLDWKSAHCFHYLWNSCRDVVQTA